MNIQAEKIELIKLIADLESEKILQKIKIILAPAKKNRIAELEEKHSDDEKIWRDISTRNFLKGYGEGEPEYSDDDIKEQNTAYKAWNGK